MMTPTDIAASVRTIGRIRLPRLLAQLWGTTNLGDCLVALAYLATPWRLVRGPVISQYEDAFTRQLGVAHGYSFSSGRLALYGLLGAMGIGKDDEVLLQVPTHIVVPNAIRYTGARPVYVDCSLDTYNMDLEVAERRITSKTKALLIQHTFGIPADMDAVMALARRYGLFVIEDCVHSLGSKFDGRPTGTIGDAAFFSTEETKTISSIMGGMAVTDNPDIAKRLRDFQSSCAWPSTLLVARYVLKLIVYHFVSHPYVHHLSRPIYMYLRRNPMTHLAPGATDGNEQQGGVKPNDYEQRLSNSQANIALRQLRRLRENLAHRNWVANEYRTRLQKTGLPVPKPPAKAETAFVRFPVRVEDRPSMMRKASKYVILGQWFNSVLEESASPAHGAYEMGSCPRAEEAAEHLVNLPTHPRVTSRDIQDIVSVISEAPSEQERRE